MTTLSSLWNMMSIVSGSPVASSRGGADTANWLIRRRESRARTVILLRPVRSAASTEGRRIGQEPRTFGHGDHNRIQAVAVALKADLGDVPAVGCAE
ncbi:hypothetical protein, partial [Streptomyces sp. NPDC060210]|uniref:hypothetical protein n=1 Tax=Streptomyces sp. NPDC060210 TaxID=3347074 RepID=UPI00366141D9